MNRLRNREEYLGHERTDRPGPLEEARGGQSEASGAQETCVQEEKHKAQVGRRVEQAQEGRQAGRQRLVEALSEDQEGLDRQEEV